MDEIEEDALRRRGVLCIIGKEEKDSCCCGSTQALANSISATALLICICVFSFPYNLYFCARARARPGTLLLFALPARDEERSAASSNAVSVSVSVSPPRGGQGGDGEPNAAGQTEASGLTYVHVHLRPWARQTSYSSRFRLRSQSRARAGRRDRQFFDAGSDRRRTTNIQHGSEALRQSETQEESSRVRFRLFVVTPPALLRRRRSGFGFCHPLLPSSASAIFCICICILGHAVKPVRACLLCLLFKARPARHVLDDDDDDDRSRVARKQRGAVCLPVQTLKTNMPLALHCIGGCRQVYVCLHPSSRAHRRHPAMRFRASDKRIDLVKVGAAGNEALSPCGGSG
ncbi:hypothetical protein DFH11DRAFT_610827 [Phellopilus nigrolimitatus]|nr:hypothetical protein DFH11DRAFT_610827 [Phellopilus nigrolimitatus]